MSANVKPGPDGPGLFSFITLGCKSNQYDSAAMAAQLEDAGLSRGLVGESHVIVVNTCMVTGPTEAQCRKAIRQARRANPAARLVVAGCMAAGMKKKIEDMEEVDLVIEPSRKGILPRLLGIGGTQEWTDWPEDPAVLPGERDRGFLKVQDGCDASCTYCIVPLVRGSSRSLHPESVLGAVRLLMDRGMPEVVLSGIHLGQYGVDLKTPCSLEDLLERLLDEKLSGRLRLSSVEPLEITPRLVKILAGADGSICRHIHIPLQSGSDRVLESMGRPYTNSHFSKALRLLKDEVPGIGIGCDVICGFPGETEEDFRRTRDLIEQFQVPFVHAFPYSPRPGTVAAAMKDDVPYQVKKERVNNLRSLAEINRQRFGASFIGQILQTALEKRINESGRLLGLSDNYLRIAVNDDFKGLTPGRIAGVLIRQVDGDVLVGSDTGSL